MSVVCVLCVCVREREREGTEDEPKAHLNVAVVREQLLEAGVESLRERHSDTSGDKAREPRYRVEGLEVLRARADAHELLVDDEGEVHVQNDAVVDGKAEKLPGRPIST